MTAAGPATRTAPATPGTGDDPAADTAAPSVRPHSGRTVVTGIGIAAPNGLGTEAYWHALLRGRNGIDRIRRFDPAQYPVTLFGEVPDFTAKDHLPSRLLPQTDHMTQLALTAAEWALEDAGVTPGSLPTFDMGVVTANAYGGFEFSQRELEKLWSRGGNHVSAYQSFAWFYAVNSGQVSIRHGMRGPGGVIVSEQSGGLDAVAQSRRQVRKGMPLLLSGGIDGALCPFGWAAYLTNSQLSTATDPERAYLPFDAAASGWIPGEGGALLVVEDEAGARARGASRPYGEIRGYAAGFDPAPETGRPPVLRRVIEQALADAGLAPADIDVVFADAAGVPELDRIEAAAITAVFGVRGVPVTAPKTMTGRLAAGGSALDLATALLTLRHGAIPPTVHVATPAPGCEDLDLVLGEPRPGTPRTALVIARGYGGFTSAMAVSAPRDAA
ncbi:ketosynthase chain-length factor [Yinghuangia aomiensis]|uniref:Ketosynthase chain-length factor n=1 Tax=Yinghuangia aomiensis TaxID=676205 RepID=A0ABP9I1C5_9ACTN